MGNQQSIYRHLADGKSTTYRPVRWEISDLFIDLMCRIITHNKPCDTSKCSWHVSGNCTSTIHVELIMLNVSPVEIIFNTMYL